MFTAGSHDLKSEKAEISGTDASGSPLNLEVDSLGFVQSDHVHNVGRTLRFDSTHFKDDSDVTIKVTGVTWQDTFYPGGTTVKSQSWKIHNKAICYMSDLAPSTVYEMNTNGPIIKSSGYKIFGNSWLEHSRTEILSAIADNTFFYGATHGGTTNIGTVLTDSYGDTILPGEVKLEVIKKKKDFPDGDPTLYQPQYGFVYLQSCWTGQDATFATCFNVNAAGTLNRAMFGWKDSVLAYPARDFAIKLIQRLSEGKTLGQSITDAEMAAPGIAPAEEAIYGDINTKIHGLYGTDSSSWYAVD